MQSPLRMIDANANRAAEGLRVMEDVARFGLDHAALAAACKGARHDLRSALALLPGGRLGMLAARDTPGDVGTTGKVEKGELVRGSLSAVAASAGGRVMEALRAVEEGAKLVDPLGVVSATVEQVRYRVYEIDRQLGLAMGTGRAPQWRLCVLITKAMCRRPWLEVAKLALQGGADCLQLREKQLGDGELLKRARALVDLARGAPDQASVIVNDRADIALASGADGVHLGQEDATVADVRRIAGDLLIVGVSTHNISEARRALHDGADYAGVGAMFQTETKVREASGAAYLRAFLELTRETRPLPFLAIGGITPENAGGLVDAGCRGVAVSSVVCGSDDPLGVCRRLRDLMGR